MDNRQQQRNRLIIRASAVSVAGNGVLSLAKVVTGFLTGSLAVLGDGIDSAVDILISLMTLFTARVMDRKPDKSYPFGYGRAEATATGILAIAIFFAGLQLLIRSVSGLAGGVDPGIIPSLAIWVTVGSIGGKMGLAWHQYRSGKRANSTMLIANAKNMLSDVVISVGVLVGLLLIRITGIGALDYITSLLVSLWIIRVSLGLYLESSRELMDGVEDTAIYSRIIQIAGAVDCVGEPHRVRARKLGASLIVYLDIEVDGDMTVREAHRVSQQVEDALKEGLDNVYDVIVHVEPKGNREDETFGVCERTL